MKLQESIRRHAVACNVVHFLPGKINILRVYVRRRCSLLKRDYLPTLDRAPNAKTRATETLASCCNETISFLPYSFREFIEIFPFSFFFIPVSFVFSAYYFLLFFSFFFRYHGEGEGLASKNPGIFLDKIYGNSIDTRGLFVLQAFDVYI